MYRRMDRLIHRYPDCDTHSELQILVGFGGMQLENAVFSVKDVSNQLKPFEGHIECLLYSSDLVVV